MDAEEKYLFDLMGFLVVPQVLAREEVGELNALIDSYDLWRNAESSEEPAWVNDPCFMTVGAPHTWVLSNHDVTRPVTRYGRDDSSFAFARKRFGTPAQSP